MEPHASRIWPVRCAATATAAAAAAAAVLALSCVASAGTLPVAISPLTPGGSTNFGLVNNHGLATALSVVFPSSQFSPSKTAVARWTFGGSQSQILDNFGTFENGYTGDLSGIDDVGVIYGSATALTNGVLRTRASYWTPDSTSPTLMPIPAGAIASTISGSAGAVTSNGVSVGSVLPSTSRRVAARWENRDAAPVLLGDLGTSATGDGQAYAVVTNAAGMTAGVAEKYVDGVLVGQRAVRWMPGSTSAIELGSIDARANNSTYTYAMNAAGAVVGTSSKPLTAPLVATVPVRWNAGSTTPQELARLTRRTTA